MPDNRSSKKEEDNNFYVCLTDALRKKFDADFTAFVSEKKKLIHLSLNKPVFQYSCYKRIITFIRKYWEGRTFFLYHIF